MPSATDRPRPNRLPAIAAAWLLAPAALLGGTPPAAATPVQTGQQIFTRGAGGPVAACADCHGPQGHGDAARGYPAIAGMPASYTARQLQAFVEGKRANPTMRAIAKGLKAELRQAVAAYVQTLRPADAAAEPTPDDTLVDRGRRLFVYGKKISRDSWLPACRLCHGDRAQGAGSAFPPLAGQHASYLRTQLKAWKQGDRSSDPQGLMTAIAGRLDDDDIQAVAAYLASFHVARQPVWPYRAQGARP